MFVGGNEISDEQILSIVQEIDLELFNLGIEIERRDMQVPFHALKKLGYDYGLPIKIENTDNFVLKERVIAAFKSIYRKNDLATGGHIGVFMYRDVFARFSVPRGFGSYKIEPFKCVDLTETQLRILNLEPDNIAMYLDQFSDIADIQFGIAEIKKLSLHSELVVRYINSARFQLHGAAAILTGGYDYAGAVQCSSLATELALKAGAAANGLTEAVMSQRPYGHNQDNLINFIKTNWLSFDHARVLRAVGKQPPYVQGRYSATQPSRREIGVIAMSAQYVVAEVVRQMCDRDFRKDVKLKSQRAFPV